MASTVALNSSGTQTATIGTEHTLATITANGVYQLVVDTGAMVNSDELELREYLIVLSAGAERLSMIGSYKHIQSQPIKRSILVGSDISVKYTLKQTAGTGRAYPWKVLAY